MLLLFIYYLFIYYLADAMLLLFFFFTVLINLIDAIWMNFRIDFIRKEIRLVVTMKSWSPAVRRATVSVNIAKRCVFLIANSKV